MMFEDVVIGQFNEMAVKATQMVVECPGQDYPVLIIQGELGSGKSHIMLAIFTEATFNGSIKFATGDSVLHEMIRSMKDQTYLAFTSTLENVDILIIDDFQDLSHRSGTQNCLFRVIKKRIENKKQTIITTAKPISEIHGIIEEIESLFMAALIVEILEPSIEDKLLITKHMAKYRDLSLYEDVVQFIAQSSHRNFHEILGALVSIEASSKILKQEITLAFAKEHTRFNFHSNTKKKGSPKGAP